MGWLRVGMQVTGEQAGAPLFSDPELKGPANSQSRSSDTSEANSVQEARVAHPLLIGVVITLITKKSCLHAIYHVHA